MNILLLGSGGRESALAWKISNSYLCDTLYIAPGNSGTDEYGFNLPEIRPTDFESVSKAVDILDIDMLVVGNEDPLVAGIRNYMEEHQPDLLIVGPGADGACLEGSKDFAKQFMSRHSIPTARYQSFNADSVEAGKEFLKTLKAPYVLKADGLAAGKGVLIIDSLDEACDKLGEMLGGMFGKASATVVIEEFLSGIECSVFVLTDGHGGYEILPVAKDYKRVGEGDTGLNTGGMGAVSPVPFADETFMTKVRERIVEPTVKGLIADGIDYRGFIFLGLINVGGEPMVIEYNVRMGDPETEVVMLRIDGDLVESLEAAARGDLSKAPGLATTAEAAATVIAVSGGYPGSYPKGMPITYDWEKVPESAIYFNAGTKIDPYLREVTSGGRVMACSATGDTLAEAVDNAMEAVEAIQFDGKYFRRDIGRDVLSK